VKKRHGVLALLGAVSVITFIDRLAIAVAGPGLQRDVHLTPVEWGWVLSSYVIANTVFEIPSGALGDRYGQRAELSRIAFCLGSVRQAHIPMLPASFRIGFPNTSEPAARAWFGLRAG
jgi:MFS family permease